ncbi:hypothetical protein BKA65DRAFT_47309 [Rhexocercosporidium sp. MPI-PUGE-AT-0058]|nr:hypothetical protein BKA65DRAFT_47309 [Rhexocercosporidium sp. MPI-PUGE-AT-0058]
MSTTPSRPNGDAAPAPPVFSYAQAAKGRAASTTASAMQSHQSTASGISTPAKDPQSTINTPSAGSERGDRSVNGSVEAPSKVEVAEPTRTTETKASTSLKLSSSTASPSFGTASTSTLPTEDKDDEFTLVGGPDSNRDRHSATDKAADGEGRRAKKGKKQKNAEKEAEKESEKEKEEVKPEVFVPAPIPTVNFWQQRKEEAAKAKPSPVVGQSPQTIGSSQGDLTSTPNGKTAEKKRGKTEEGLSPAQNGTPKDTQSANRSQKKGGDTPGKKEDQSGKRAGARGSRAIEKDEKAAASQLPPPVEDAMSWPTPETALEEEKRKAQEKTEKEDKDENTSNKPRPKKEWVAVPYTPSVTFNTPLPTRGGRGRGGARGGRTEAGGRTGHSTNGTGEKPQNASATEASPADRESRSSSVPPATKSRPSNEPSSARKPSVAQGGEKAKSSASKNESTSDIRNLPNGGQPDQSFEVSQDTRGDNKGLKQEQNFFENQSYQRSSADRKGDQNMRAPDQFKDNSNFNKEGMNQARGNDGQSNRGRGGFRGRVGHGAFANGQPHPPNVFTNGHGGPPAPNSYPIRQASGPYSPPLQPLPFSNQYVPPPSRGGRGGSRSQSIPNNGIYGRYPPNGGLAQHMSPIQTSNPYDYQHMQGPMSAQPYQPYMDQVSVLAMVTMQLEYYFSIDNLCKDVFLRKHMDSQGFVFLAFIAGFKRIQALTQEFELLRFACQESEIIELVRGDDGHDRLRRKEGWEKWVLGMEERDESVRNAGPTFHQRSQQNQHRGSMVMPNQHTMSPVAFQSNGTEAGFRPYANGNGVPAPALSNGNGGAYFPETPLSAAVPDFSPGMLPILNNGPSEPLDIETTFSDDEVAHLILVFKAPKGNEDSKPKSPFHGMPSRTFSNGSIDGRSIAEELYDDQRQSRSLVNGSHASEAGSPDSVRRPRSPFGAMSPTQSSFNNGPPVMWVKGQKQQAFVSPGSSEELYTKFRARALQHRDTSAPGESHADMKLLYEFWSHFLCRNFNAAMYHEFRNFAFEDAQSKAMSGVNSLISYYAEVLSSKKKVIPSVLALHYVDLVKNEDPSGPRPALEKLRVAWRDGALDMKSRKRIDNLVDSKLREELERAPHQKSDMS